MAAGIRMWTRSNRWLLLGLFLSLAVASVLGIAYSLTVACAQTMTPAQCRTFLTGSLPSTLATGFLAILPVVAGVLLGVEAVGRDLEDGNAAFAWSIAIDRFRWLRSRVVPGLLATVLLAAIAGAVNALIVARLNPGHNIWESFVGYGLWGPLLVVRAVCAYATGLLVGAWIGRLVPGLLLSLVMTAAILPTALLAGRWDQPVQILRSGDARAGDGLGVEFGAVGPGGRFMQPMECQQMEPSGLSGADEDAWLAENCQFASKFILGSEMPQVEAREAVVLLLTVLGYGAASTIVVMRRRP